MDYEDYQNQTFPSRQPIEPEKAIAIYGKLKQIAKCTKDKEAREPPFLCLYVEIPGCPELVGIPFTKEKTDVLIGTLISARNTIWPTP